MFSWPCRGGVVWGVGTAQRGEQGGPRPAGPAHGRRGCAAAAQQHSSLQLPPAAPSLPAPHLEMVHDLHLPPHIINVLLAPAGVQVRARQTQHQPARTQACRHAPSLHALGACLPPQHSPRCPSSRELALGNGLARQLLGLARLGLSDAGRTKLAAPQHLAQVVIRRHVLSRQGTERARCVHTRARRTNGAGEGTANRRTSVAPTAAVQQPRSHSGACPARCPARRKML